MTVPVGCCDICDSPCVTPRGDSINGWFCCLCQYYAARDRMTVDDLCEECREGYKADMEEAANNA